jgi:hypothetical protein
LEVTGEKATVHSFFDERKPFLDVPIGTIATAWVDPTTSEVLIIVMNEALYFGERLDHTLICPNQLRSFGVQVDDTLQCSLIARLNIPLSCRTKI